MAATRALAARGGAAQVVAWDRGDSSRVPGARAELQAEGVRVVVGGDGVALLDELVPGCVVRSPGIRIDTPVPQAAAKRGIPVLDELELGWRLDRRPVVAVTGTNGKSTTSQLVSRILTAAGHPAAVTGNTMFGPPYSGLAPDAADVVVTEVSTFQLEACPAFLPDAAVVTNLTEDHQDRHGSMEAYGALKRRAFLRDGAHVEAAVVGVDQDFGRELAADLERAGARVRRVGAEEGAGLRLVDSRWRDGHALVRASDSGEPLELSLRLPGRHNALNALMALALTEALGVPRATALDALAQAEAPPGRLEAVDGVDGFTVLIDYAHTPDGTRAALEGARAMTPDGATLRVVVSMLWNYDEHHRRGVGEAAARAADHLLLTLDRVGKTEPLDALPTGFEEAATAAAGPGKPVEVVLDRETAIAEGLRRAAPGDVVAVLGRGARAVRVEPDNEVGHRTDLEIVRAALAELGRSV